jgi:hypothetical protein
MSVDLLNVCEGPWLDTEYRVPKALLLVLGE